MASSRLSIEKIGCLIVRAVRAYRESAPSASGTGLHRQRWQSRRWWLGRGSVCGAWGQCKSVASAPKRYARGTVRCPSPERGCRLSLHTFTHVLVSPQTSGAGSVRDAGGAFSKREQAEEERYFRWGPRVPQSIPSCLGAFQALNV